MIEFDESVEQSAVIKVIGVGGGGGNAVNTMIASSIHKVDFIVANTDAQALRTSKAPVKLQLGKQLTKGLGAGSKPEVGTAAALENKEQLAEAIKGADLVFIAAGMGGGTGTGAAPVIAEAARETGVLTVGVVTKPFTYEGKARTLLADQGIAELKKHVDSLIIIPNDRLISLASRNMSLFDAFKPSDDVLRQAVQGISELITSTGLMNLDFADVKTVMSVRGMAMMGIGMGSGDNRAADAVNNAISSPLLEDNDISGAKGVLVNISGSEAMTMDDYNTVNRIVHEKVHEEANIKIGVVRDDTMGDNIKVTVIATGLVIVLMWKKRVTTVKTACQLRTSILLLPCLLTGRPSSVTVREPKMSPESVRRSRFLKRTRISTISRRFYANQLTETPLFRGQA